MASELHVDAIKHSGGTSALTIDSSGNVHKAGMVVQIQKSSIGGNITTTSSSPVASGLQCAIAPKFSSSLIQVELIGGRNYIVADQQLDISLFKDGSNVNTVGTGRWESIYSNSHDHHNGGYSACYFETAGSTSSRTYQVYFDVGSGTGYFTNSPSGNNEYLVHLVITEIAQ